MYTSIFVTVLLAIALPIAALWELHMTRKQIASRVDLQEMREVFSWGKHTKRWVGWGSIVSGTLWALMAVLQVYIAFILVACLSLIATWLIVRYRQKLLARVFVETPPR